MELINNIGKTLRDDLMQQIKAGSRLSDLPHLAFDHADIMTDAAKYYKRNLSQI